MAALAQEAQRLRIYTGDNDKIKGRPVHELVVEEARRRGLAGATVLYGVAGFGANSLVHTTKILRLSEGLPLVVEIVDAPEKIQAFLPFLNDIVLEGLVTMEPVEVMFYRHNSDGE